MKRKMFLGGDNNIFENARLLRENPTNAEIVLWSYLKQKPLGCKFRRQHPISIYVADFYCHSLKMIIEVDGDVHTDIDVQKRDIERQKNLESEGINFIRFTNQDVSKNLEGVIKKIEDWIMQIQKNRAVKEPNINLISNYWV